jgi:hypothetical protein
MRMLSIGALSVCLALAACGGSPWCEPEAGLTGSGGGAAGGDGGGAGDGGGSGGGGDEPMPLQVPRLAVKVSYIKTFSFDWQAVPGATAYRLYEDLDGPAGPQAGRLIADLPADRLSFAAEVFLPDRINASYQLQACNATGCASSAPQGIPDIDRGIGFFKASQVAPEDQFGASLAVSADGQLFAVGVPSENGANGGIDSAFEELISEGDSRVGAVYVFRRGDSGWVRDAYIKPDPAQRRGYFGASVALAGDAQGYTLLVGAPEDRTGGQGVNADPDPNNTPPVVSSGAAYVFERAANGAWSQYSFIKPETPSAGANFGWSVSLSQDRQWVAVGQPRSADGGSVSLYQRGAAGWGFVWTLQGSNTESEDDFGAALQLDASGETLVVGAAGEDGGSASLTGGAATDDDTLDAAGAVYVFRRSGSSWGQTSYLKSLQRGDFHRFGATLALSSAGHLLAVGEPGAVVGAVAAGPVLGRVHLFSLVGSNWLLDRDFVSPLGLADGAFGEAVALATDAEGLTLVIGDPSESTAGSGLTTAPAADGQTASAGSAFVYRRQGAGVWSAAVPVKAPNNQTDLDFGAALALSANRATLAVFGRDNSGLTGIGATPNTDSSVPESGAVYLY